jgi:hypothetical protein
MMPTDRFLTDNSWQQMTVVPLLMGEQLLPLDL